MKTILSFVDIVVVPSREESFSLSVAEAMMMEKMCVLSDHCGIAENIIDKENGLVFRSCDSDQLADLLDWCVLNMDECRKIGRAAREAYEEYFSDRVFNERLNAIISD